MKSDPVENDAPHQPYPILRRLIPKKLHPLARSISKRLTQETYRPEEPYCWTYAYTGLSMRRQESILEKATVLVADGVEGDFVECGVLDGGTSALLAYAARHDDRRIHLFDAWQGLPDTVPEDGEGAKKWVGDVVGSPKRVRNVLSKVGANTKNVVVHHGWFNDTLPKCGIEKIAFLHIDCDFYEPTKLVLETLVPMVVKGGWVQIDDYTGFEGSRKAVNGFLEMHPDIILTVEDVPGGAIYFQMP